MVEVLSMLVVEWRTLSAHARSDTLRPILALEFAACIVPGFEAAQRLVRDEQPHIIHEHSLAVAAISPEPGDTRRHMRDQAVQHQIHTIVAQAVLHAV